MQLFTSTRPETFIPPLSSEFKKRSFAMEEAWAIKMGIEDADYRKEQLSAATKGYQQADGTWVPDRPDEAPASDTFYGTETPKNGDETRDRQSPD